MLHKTLESHLSELEAKIQSIRECYIERYEEELLSDSRANVRVRLRFKNGFLLELNEAILIIKGRLSFLTFRYHLQTEKNDLIFRYDSTPHFPDIESFPYHKHTPDAVVSSSPPDIFQVIDEAMEEVTKRNL